jgi:hypothetical protein
MRLLLRLKPGRWCPHRAAQRTLQARLCPLQRRRTLGGKDLHQRSVDLAAQLIDQRVRRGWGTVGKLRRTRLVIKADTHRVTVARKPQDAARRRWYAIGGQGHAGEMERPRPACRWCGRTVASETLRVGITVDPASGEEIVVTACTEEHLQALLRFKRWSTSPEDD